MDAVRNPDDVRQMRVRIQELEDELLAARSDRGSLAPNRGASGSTGILAVALAITTAFSAWSLVRSLRRWRRWWDD